MNIGTPIYQSNGLDDPHVAHMRQLIHIFRAEQHLPPLTWHTALAEVCYEHSLDMASSNPPFCSHENQEGLMPWDRARLAGLTGYVAECYCCGTKEAVPVLEAWKASPSHLAVLVDTRFTVFGVAQVGGRWTLMYMGWNT